MKRSFILACSLLSVLTLLLSGCKDDLGEPTGQGNLKIEFENVVGASGLTLNNQTYRNANGDAYTVSQLMYHVSNVSLRKKDSSTYQVPESYFLID